MPVISRRILSIFISFCLIFTQTAQAYSLAWLSYKYQHTTITTHSGGDTLIEAGKLNAQGSIDLSATGYAATTNADGSTNAGRDGKITFAAVKDNTYTNVTNSNNSFAWQNANGGGENVDTLKLANISADKGLSVNAKGGVVVDIPDVPATPAPAPKRDANGKLIPVVPLTPEQQAAQRQADLNKAIQNLSSQPGQAWISQLAHDPKVKVQWNQVQTAVQHWNYSHDGLTPEAVAVIAIVVTYCTAGTAGGAADAAVASAGMTGAAATVASAAIAAGMTTLASEASIALINNKGDLGKTLNDLGSSQNVKSLVTAMLTAGVMKGLSSTDFMQGLNDGAGGPLSASSLASRLELNLTNATVNTAINSAVYGTSFTDAFGNNLKNAGIDTLAAVAANGIGQSYKGDGGLLNGQPVLHDLAHAVLGCASASAKGQDCGSGALGGAVGEATAGLFGGTTDGSQLTPEQQGKVIFLTQLATAGAAIATGSNLNTALGTSQNAVVNNYLSYNEVTDLQKKIKACSGDNACVNSLMAAAVKLSNSRNSTDLLNPALAQDVAAGSTLLSATANNPTANGFVVASGAEQLLNINGSQQATADAVPALTAPPIAPNPYNGTYQAGQSANLQESLVIAGAPALMSVPGTIGTLSSLTAVAGGSYQFGQGLGALNDGQYGAGALDMGLGSLAIFGGSVGLTQTLGVTAVGATDFSSSIITNVRAISADEANAPFVARGSNPPYDAGSQIRTFTTTTDLQFVRVSTTENPQGAFLVRADEIAGMTPQQIQQHLALPYIPTQIADITVPAGTSMQVGRVAAQPTFGVDTKGGVQYQLQNNIPDSSFGTPRPLQ